MRLIDVKTLELKEFFHNIPPYAILSHTWGNEEVTFQEYLLATGHDAKKHAHIKRKAGFSKILGACKRAKADKLGYLWCDTNCIDKSSSAELSEAINTMYAWYRDSVVCYAYLTDVDSSPGSFRKSRWFTRGWTLQELLIPRRVIFFNWQWDAFGDRENLSSVITTITRVHIGVLHAPDTVHAYSIAQRMSWAAGRSTSRQEDIAYCLLGIFGVNMPLLYGEGSRAFERLQHEIIKISNDQSILAWDTALNYGVVRTGALAYSPDGFRPCGSIVQNSNISKSPYSATNLGISVELPVIDTCMDGIVLVGLNCSKGLDTDGDCRRARKHFQIWLWLWESSQGIFERVHIPASTSMMQHSYPYSVRHSARRLLIVASLPDAAQHPIPKTYQMNRINPTISSGFSITVGFGTINPRTQTFEEVRLPGKFSITTIKGRCQCSLSHVIVSNGNYSTIMSISWDEDARPRDWKQTTFSDPNGYLAREVLARQDWAFLFDVNNQELVSTHERIRNQANLLPHSSNGGKPPFISIASEPMRNLHGQQEVVAAMTFQEPSRRIRLPEVRQILGLI